MKIITTKMKKVIKSADTNKLLDGNILSFNSPALAGSWNRTNGSCNVLRS